MTDGSGSSFLSSTPERLYARTGRMVTSEAVAATRPRGPPGDVEQDFWLSVDLLNSDKDHREFVLVRDWVRDALSSCAHTVHVEVPKTVIKQVSALRQHLAACVILHVSHVPADQLSLWRVTICCVTICCHD